MSFPGAQPLPVEHRSPSRWRSHRSASAGAGRPESRKSGNADRGQRLSGGIVNLLRGDQHQRLISGGASSNLSYRLIVTSAADLSFSNLSMQRIVFDVIRSGMTLSRYG